MPSIYLQSSDYSNYGLPQSTTQSQVIQASAIIDAYTKRQPKGLLYSLDYSGAPCYMSAVLPTLSFVAAGGIISGSNITVTLSGSIGFLQVGEVLIVDRNNTNLTESCIVSSINPQNKTIILSNVINNHASGVTLDSGMTIFEEKSLLSQKPITQLSYSPIVNLISGVGQYGYERRGDNNLYTDGDFNLLSQLTAFGGAPGWTFFSISDTQVNYLTGDVWIPSGVYLSYFTNVRMWYIAGWTYQNLPYEIKQACANIVNALSSASSDGFSGNIKLYRAGDTEIQKFSASYLDSDTKSLLDRYCVRIYL